MPRPKRQEPEFNVSALIDELTTMRELYATQRKALENVKPFLLELHRASVYLPGNLAQNLADILRPFLNRDDQRPRGAASRRSKVEKHAIVNEYDVGLQSGWGGGAAVCRKYGVSVLTIKRWRDQIADDSMPVDPKWLDKPDPFADALSRISLPSSDLWQPGGSK